MSIASAARVILRVDGLSFAWRHLSAGAVNAEERRDAGNLIRLVEQSPLSRPALCRAARRQAGLDLHEACDSRARDDSAQAIPVHHQQPAQVHIRHLMHRVGYRCAS